MEKDSTAAAGLVTALQDFFRKLNGTPDDPALFRAWQCGMMSGNRTVPAPPCEVDKSYLSTIYGLCDQLGLDSCTLERVALAAFDSVSPRFHIFSPEEAVLAVLAGDVPPGMLSRRSSNYRKAYRLHPHAELTV